MISDEIRNYIFDPFVMGDYARKSGNGNGLGLCIAAKIIALHHGSIRLCEENNSEFSKAFVIMMPDQKKLSGRSERAGFRLHL